MAGLAAVCRGDANLTASSAELKKGLKYRAISQVLKSKHPQGKDLNPGNVTQALQAASALQVQKDIKPIVLDYDQTKLSQRRGPRLPDLAG